MSKIIYLDHASATPVSSTALAAMQPYFSTDFYNPSAPYLPARKVRQDYQQAKDALAHVIGAKGNDLVMTAGATESTNLAFTAIGSQDFGAREPKVLILETEHVSVRAAAKKSNYDVIKVDKTGTVDLSNLAAKISHSTQLVSVSLADNELGTIQPLAKISEILATERDYRLCHGIITPLYLHTDASQALALLDISVARLGVDLMTLNSAKVYGPKGVGALYISHHVNLHPITVGGGQERGLRSGTENVPGVIGFAAAATEAKQHLKHHREQYEEFNKILVEELKKSIIKPKFLGNSNHKLANFCSVSFPGIDAERIIYILEDQGILLSTGAACAARKGEPSHVLKAIGLSEEEISGSLRISLGQTNTAEDVRTAGRAIAEAVRAEYERVRR